MPSILHVPKYRRHKPTGQAVVTLNGRDFYLGKWGSAASKAEYQRFTGEWMAAGRCLYTIATAGLTVAEMVRAYWTFAQSYYQKQGRPTSTLEAVKQALRPLRRLYGTTACQ